MENNGQYVTASQARVLMGVSQYKMTELLKSGELPSIKSPRDKRVTLIKRSDVEAWIARAGPPLSSEESKDSGRPAA